MRRIGILGDIGSGKTYIAKCFGYPVFNADQEVANLYKKDKKILLKLRKVLPEYFDTPSINKENITRAILDKHQNLKTIIKIVHLEIKKRLNFFWIELPVKIAGIESNVNIAGVKKFLLTKEVL